jgi:hypothetical protein
MLIPVNARKDLNMTDKRFLTLFSNYNRGDRYPAFTASRGSGCYGGTVLSVSPIGDEAQQPGTVESVDLLQRPSDYRVSSNVMKEILQKSVSADNKARQERTPQVKAMSVKEKKTRTRSDKVRRTNNQEASSQSIVSDYNKLKTKKSKQDFISSLGQIYSQNPTGSDYILKGIEMIKAL